MRVCMWYSADGWRVRLVARNGRILLASEAYSRWGKARKMVQLLRRVFPLAVRVFCKGYVADVPADRAVPRRLAGLRRYRAVGWGRAARKRNKERAR